MNRKDLTIEQFNKLKPCIVTTYRGTWNHYRIVRKNKRWTRVAFLSNDGEVGQTVLQLLYKNDYVTLK